MKRLLFFALTVFLSLSLCFSAYAETTQTELKENEREALVSDIGLDEEELEDMPPHILQALIDQGAKKIGSKTVTHKFNEGQSEMNKSLAKKKDEEDDFSEIELKAKAFEVKSDRSGYRKYYLYGKFEWSEPPIWTLTDKMSIGYPATSKFFMPMTSKGKPDDHENRYCTKPAFKKKWECEDSSKASDWDPGIGVAAEYDLQMGNRQLHSGYISQYVYADKHERGTINIKFQYGHAIIGGSISVSYKPVGLSIQPEKTTQVADFGIEFKYPEL
ncbi:hypothetical protein [Brevibacillus laterosporus]|uniref:hypothetical protein n=1 Tax=Brevibacillus laterosporus TaxID=1465 RepID=UPI003D20D6E9